MTVKSNVLNQSRLHKPPNKSCDGGQNNLDIHAGGTDSGPVPFVWQSPTVGDIAIQARREYEQHKSDFVTFTAQSFTRKAVTEFVEDFSDSQYADENITTDANQKMLRIPATWIETRSSLMTTEPRAIIAAMDVMNDRRWREQPPGVLVQEVQYPLWVETPIANGQDVGHLPNAFHQFVLASTFKQPPSPALSDQT